MIDSSYQPRATAHLRKLANRYRDLTVSARDLKTLDILSEMVRDYGNEAAAIEGTAAHS
jgi:hypothetical protein